MARPRRTVLLSSPSTTGSSPPAKQEAGQAKTLYVLLLVLNILLIALLYFVIWRFFCKKKQRVDDDNNSDATTSSSSTPNSPNFHSRNGSRLDSRAVSSSSLPVFVYSIGGEIVKTECGVCLMEFEEGETGRMLPRCNHGFHTECVDMWFRSHSTCPLCRASVESGPSDSGAGAV